MCVRSDGSKMYIKLGKEIDSVKVLSVYEGKEAQLKRDLHGGWT